MAIIQHPLAAQELGEFQEHVTFNAAKPGEQADWKVTFYYEHGYVIMSVQQNNYKYETVLNKKVETNNCFESR